MIRTPSPAPSLVSGKSTKSPPTAPSHQCMVGAGGIAGLVIGLLIFAGLVIGGALYVGSKRGPMLQGAGVQLEATSKI